MDWINKQQKERVAQGRKKYGKINLRTDPRSFKKESVEELVDALNYLGWSYKKGEIDYQRWRLADRCIRFALELIHS